MQRDSQSVTYPIAREERLGFLNLPSAAASDLTASVAFGPWRYGRSWLLSAGGLRFPLLGASFPVFRVFVCRDDAQVAMAVPHAIMFPWIQPHLDGDGEKLVGVVWSSRISSGCGIFGSSRSFIGSSSYFFVSGTDVVFSTRSATSCPQSTTPGQLREERQRRRAVDTV
jgi:hypothetical protein